MKKFILCVVAGYALVFTLFIGLPQMMGGRGETLVPKGGNAPAVPEALHQTELASNAKKSATTLQPSQAIQPIQKPEPLKQYKTGPIETFYRNGTLSSEWIQQSPGTGIFKTYTPEGRPWMAVPFVNSVLEGECKTFYPEGPLFSRENYELGEKKGSFFWQYKNGNPWLEITWNANGTALLSALYSEAGQRVDLPAVGTEQTTGYFKAFDAQGNEVINLQQGGGEQNLVLKSYYISGAPSAAVGLRGKRLYGRVARYYPDGIVWMETEFLENQPLQNTGVYFENKALAFTETPVLGPRAGLEWKAYYPDGKIFWQIAKLVSQDRESIFQLTAHWQDETSTDAKKERTLL